MFLFKCEHIQNNITVSLVDGNIISRFALKILRETYNNIEFYVILQRIQRESFEYWRRLYW